ATRMLRAFLTEQGLDESELSACELCLAEACNNAVQYAGDDAARKSVIAEAICRDTCVELVVTDHSAGFEFPAEITMVGPDCENGRGLFIIRSMMDDVIYYRGHGRNTLVMRKNRTYQQHRSAEETNVTSLVEAR